VIQSQGGERRSNGPTPQAQRRAVLFRCVAAPCGPWRAFTAACVLGRSWACVQAKLAAERVLRDFAASNPDFKAAVLRYFNVYGSDPKGRLGEYPRPDLRHHGRISGACFDAALGNINELTVMGTNFPTPDGYVRRATNEQLAKPDTSVPRAPPCAEVRGEGVARPSLSASLE